MSSERINQVEYKLNNNSNDNYSLQFNLLTGRLLFNTSIINLFRNQYNLKLNLIYNSKTNFNPNMDSHLGFFLNLILVNILLKLTH